MFPSISNSPLPFAGLEALPPTPASHFKLYFLGSVLHVTGQLARNLGSLDEVLEQFPFLHGYLEELERFGAGAATPPDQWIAAIREWESRTSAQLPIRALREALALDDSAITMLFAAGLIEEDPRFGFLIECAQPVSPQQHRPTLGLLTAWWRDENDVAPVRERIRVLLDHALLQVINPDAPRLQWVFQSPPAVWDALRGEMPAMPAPWLTR